MTFWISKFWFLAGIVAIATVIYILWNYRYPDDKYYGPADMAVVGVMKGFVCMVISVAIVIALAYATQLLGVTLGVSG